MISGIEIVSVVSFGIIRWIVCEMFIIDSVFSFCVICIVLNCVVIVELLWFVIRMVVSSGLSFC